MVFELKMNPTGDKQRPRWLLTIFLSVVIFGILAAMSIPNYVGGGPSKISHVIIILRNIAVAKEELIEHGYTNNVSLTRKISAQDIAPLFSPEKDENYFTRIGLAIDKDGNLHNTQGVVFVINPLGVMPEARFTKAFKLSDRSGFFGPKISKGTVMRFSTNTSSPEMVDYILPGQESKPCQSLSELLER